MSAEEARGKAASPAAGPVFADIVSLLNTLVPVKIGAHGNFWQNTTRDIFVAKSIFGVRLITGSDPNASGLYKALAGVAPFDGSRYPQMPNTGSCDQCRHATADELALVVKWITSGAP
jgi:hypothetical protein